MPVTVKQAGFRRV